MPGLDSAWNRVLDTDPHEQVTQATLLTLHSTYYRVAPLSPAEKKHIDDVFQMGRKAGSDDMDGPW
jgi:Ser/Thr protein kinase RdoA (MazF antagonist)